MISGRHLAVCLVAAILAGCQGGQPAATTASNARMYPGLDRYHRPIKTTSPQAQKWFDQGLQLAYGFNHDEAIRSFQRAAELDPDSPMPWWGIAYCYGININRPEMTEQRWREAWQALQEARARAAGADPVEAALVEALGERYSWPPPETQKTLDLAYADAMQRLYERYPNDPDVAVLFAESIMNTQPWDYWTNEGEPKGRIEEAVDALESALATQPDHPGAMHFYIHAVEVPAPDEAEAVADRLVGRVPGAGHLVHMPSHIYVRVGRYADAADTNVRAVQADRAYLKRAPQPDYYWAYVAHNLHFLAFASMMEGRYEQALQAARELEREIPEWYLREYGSFVEGVMPTTFHVMVRFGRWEDILAEPQRPDYRLVSRAVRNYARGIAYAATGRPEEARAEVELFEAAAAEIPGDWWVFNNRVEQLLPIARAMLEGEIAFREGNYDQAYAALRRGVALEDALIYDEPPAWMLPVRHSLGALLMAGGRATEAEAVYREDLVRNPRNGWALLGLQQALAAQGRMAEAAEIRPQLAAAWQRADVKPTSSCFCAPGDLPDT